MNKNKIIRKVNGGVLGLLIACGVGLSVSNMHKAVADFYPGCPDTTGDEGCSTIAVDSFEENFYPGCTTNSGRPLDCCQYRCWNATCINGNFAAPITYCRIVGPNAFSDCQNGTCVPFGNGE